MTPKRYFAFGCLTILIQGGVLASQNTQTDLALSAGSAMGSTQAVSVSIAMQASQAHVATKADTQAQPIEPPANVQPDTAAAKPVAKKSKPVAVTKPIKQIAKVDAQTKPTQATAKQQKPLTNTAVKEPTTKDTISDAKPQQQVAHNQAKVDAKQGVTQQSVVLSQPTFAAPPTQPHYPKKARKKGFQGTATIEVIFNQVGEQLSLTLVDSSGYRLLDKAALNAVEKWQFTAPTPQTAYAYTVRVPVKFALN